MHASIKASIYRPDQTPRFLTNYGTCQDRRLNRGVLGYPFLCWYRIGPRISPVPIGGTMVTVSDANQSPTVAIVPPIGTTPIQALPVTLGIQHAQLLRWFNYIEPSRPGLHAKGYGHTVHGDCE